VKVVSGVGAANASARGAKIDFPDLTFIAFVIVPINQLTFVRTTILAVLLGLLALLSIVTATIWLVNDTQTNATAVTRASAQRAEIIEIRNSLLDAETGQRGYLLTGKEKYLLPYTLGSTNLGPELEHLEAVVEDNPAEIAAIERLRQVSKEKLAELAHTIELYNNNQHEEAQALVNTDRGRELADEAKQIIGHLALLMDQNIQHSIERQNSGIMRLRFVTFIGAFVILAVAVGSAIIILRYTRQLAEAQQAVLELNLGLEERVLERTADLGRANQEIQRFAYIVTHDLRAPLVNVMGFTSELEASLSTLQTALSRTTELPQAAEFEEARLAALEDLPESIGFIRSSTRKMDGLINAILKLSREGRRTLKPERIDLGALLQTAADNVAHLLTDAGGSLTIECRAPPIISDRLALEQIFGNLLDNAIKYRDRTRALSISIDIANEAGRWVSISVKDNGRGISKQDHERIFDLFRRSGAQDQPGEGIGLAHVRTMARNLGGEITVTSELGQGTTFKVSLSKDLRKVIGVA
jgi:signal transduction histidine kinase